MSDFIRYPHLERLGHADVDGLDIGDCWVFPKLDGTNASIWIDKVGIYRAGSRSRQLSAEQDNAGFYNWYASEDPKAYALRKYLHSFPNGTRIYGEWLVPHTFKHYREDVWKRFWVFDVLHPVHGFLAWEDYVNDATQFEGADIVQPICKISNPSKEDLLKLTELNTFLVKDGEGPGEGIVIKRYGFVNKFGRTTWAKIVRNEFKEANHGTFGVPEKDGTYTPEPDIAARVVTATLVNKERAKIELALLNEAVNVTTEEDGRRLRKSLIPRLLETVFHCVCTEELWDELKRLKNPTIDFKRLHKFVIAECKKHMGDLL